MQRRLCEPTYKDKLVTDISNSIRRPARKAENTPARVNDLKHTLPHKGFEFTAHHIKNPAQKTRFFNIVRSEG